MVVVIHSKFIVCWARYGVILERKAVLGPDSHLGIIMGFPTTLSMNLVTYIPGILLTIGLISAPRECLWGGGFYHPSPSPQDGHRGQWVICLLVHEGGFSGYPLRSCVQIHLFHFSLFCSHMSSSWFRHGGLRSLVTPHRKRMITRSRRPIGLCQVGGL
jgi:hypothetical protein